MRWLKNSEDRVHVLNRNHSLGRFCSDGLLTDWYPCRLAAFPTECGRSLPFMAEAELTQRADTTQTPGDVLPASGNILVLFSSEQTTDAQVYRNLRHKAFHWTGLVLAPA